MRKLILTILFCFICSVSFADYRKLVGAADVAAGSAGTGYVKYTKFTAEASGTAKEFRVKTTDNTGNVKFGIYADSGGEPGDKIVSVDTDNAITVTGWNTFNMPATSITSGTVYWLGVCFETTGDVGYVASGGTKRYKYQVYNGFSFPSSAGTGFSTTTTYDIIAVWGGFAGKVLGVSSPASVNSVTNIANINGVE